MSPPRPFEHPFLLALAVRLPLALVSRTFFQPDESWQSLEIAHKLVFGFGYLTWEWRPSASSVGGIRSPIYALLFVPVLGLAKALGADGWTGLVLAPKVVQAVLGAWTDASTASLGQRILGDEFKNAALVCSLVSFFNAHVSTRTFSNSAETALTAAAMACWPWQEDRTTQTVKKGKPFKSKSSLALALSLAAVATIIRPSNAVIWLVLGLHLFIHAPSSAMRFQIVRTTLAIGVLAVVACTIIDTTFFSILADSPSTLTPSRSLFSTLSFTPYTFLLQNVFNSISLFYGANTSHFYITQALPFMTMTMLPFVLHGLYISRSGSVGTARLVVGATAAVYSLLAHKEFRFVHPLLPCINVFAAHSLVSLAQTKRDKPSSRAKKELWERVGIERSHFFFLLVSLVPAVYLTSFHALGQNTVMDHLRMDPLVESVGFLMPCHSTPWQSRMHRLDLEVDNERGSGSGEGGRAWFITCEPPVLSQASKGYLDQTDFFYASPIRYLQDRFPPAVDPDFPPSPFVGAHLPSREAVDPHPRGDVNDLGWWHEWPSHIVCFDVLLTEDDGEVGWYLREMGYEVERRIWNSHFHEDSRRRGDIVVLKWIE